MGVRMTYPSDLNITEETETYVLFYSLLDKSDARYVSLDIKKNNLPKGNLIIRSINIKRQFRI